MPLAPATRLGPYEILSPLGAGGMGEVYRARDGRLGREVAIKVLPAHLSSDPELRTRFEREARTISSLNHPHICTLHDVGREGDTDYLVMELIEGETLANRLSRGALPVAEVLRLGAQIADGLDRAHRLGVIHRDLKPANVMLTRTGAKLMDFGLARAMNAGPGSDGMTMTSPARASDQPLTAKGTFLGTFVYMAPEQLEGRDADTRSDLWALGCVLYEMATGRRAFDGRSQASIVGAIMGSEPAPLSQVTALAPPALDRLIRDLLRKDPDDRVQTAHDVKLQLLGILEGLSQPGAAGSTARPIWRGSRLPWAVAAIAVLAAAGLALALVRRAPGPRGATQLSLTPPSLAKFSAYAGLSAISPDGSAIAFGAADTAGHMRLWVQRLDSPEAAPVGVVEGIAFPFWSPDSRTIGYMDAVSRKITSVPLAGGSPLVLQDLTTVPRGASWSSRGVIVYAPATQGPLYRISAAGGTPEQVTWLDSTRHEASHRFPCFLPDNDHFLFAALPPDRDGFPIYVGSLSSRKVERIFSAESAPTYAAPGYLLFRKAGKLMAQRFDAGSRKLAGDPIPLADAPPVTDIDGEPVATASNNGRLVYLSAQTPPQQLEWLDRSGRVIGILGLSPGDWRNPVLSSDDRFALVTKGNELWRVDLARSVALRLSASEAESYPVWSPDDRMVALSLRSSGTQEIHTLSADGSGEPHLVPTTSDLFKWPEQWTAHGLIFQSIGERTQRDLWLLPPSGPARPLIQTPFGESGARVSPDGKWVAYVSTEAGSADAYIQSFPEPGHKVRVSTSGADELWWMPGGTEICYRSDDGTEMMSVPLARRGEDLDPGEPRPLFRFPLETRDAQFSHDGKRVLVSVPVAGGAARHLGVILDWTALVPR